MISTRMPGFVLRIQGGGLAGRGRKDEESYLIVLCRNYISLCSLPLPLIFKLRLPSSSPLLLAS